MKFSASRAVLAASLLFAITSSPCFAQDGERGNRGGRQGQGQGPGRGGFGQGGGFGGGMMGGGMMGGGMRGDMMLLGLLRIEEVQKEIDLMPDQKEAVGKVGEKLREAPRPEAGFDLREATEEQRNQFMEKMRVWGEEQSKMVTEQMEEILLPEQLDRLRQIGLQQQGIQAFSEPSFIEKIGLKEDQQEKIRELQQGMLSQLGDIFRSGDREGMRTKMEELRGKLLDDAKGVLTAEQKSKYEEMLGKPFEMPEGAFRGFGGAAGPGGPGAGGPGGRGGDRGDRGGRGRGGRDPGNDA